MSGATCFVGTRVSIQNPIADLPGGDRREQLLGFFEEAKESVLARVA